MCKWDTIVPALGQVGHIKWVRQIYPIEQCLVHNRCPIKFSYDNNDCLVLGSVPWECLSHLTSN